MSGGPDDSRILARYAWFIVRHRLLVVLGLLVCTAVAADQACHLHLASRLADQAPQDHPNTKIWNAIRERFGLEQTGLLAVRARRGDIFTPEILERVERLTRGVEALPGVVPGTVLSLASRQLKLVEGRGEGLTVRPIMSEVPREPEDVARLRRDVSSSTLYDNLIVSRDGSTAAIVAEFSDDVPNLATQERLSALAATAADDLTETFLAGPIVLNAYIERYSARVSWLIPLTILIVALVHYEAFRTVQAMALPLITALMSLVLCLGVMGWLGYPVDPWSATAPIIILAIAAGHAVQMLKRYYEEFERCGDNRTAVVRSLVTVGPVMLTAGGIAAAGFASLATFGIQSVRVCGILLACGVLAALAIEMTLIPACRAMLPAPTHAATEGESPRSLASRAVAALGRAVLSRPRTTLAVVLTVAGSISFGVGRLVVSDSVRDAFYASSRPRMDEDAVNSAFGGTAVLHLLVEGDAPGSLEDPGVLRAIDDVERFLRDVPEIGKVISYVDFVREMHRSFAGDDQLPATRNLTAQYLLMYGMDLGPNELGWLLDSPHQSALVAAFSRSDDAKFSRELITRLRAYATPLFEGLPARMRIGAGAVGMHAALTEVIVREKLRNMAQVALVIFVLSSLALRSLVGGLLVLAPLVLAVGINIGFMGWSGIPLGVATAAITAMGVSLGADFAVYFLYRVREERRSGRALAEAVEIAFATAGQASCFVSSAVVAGYLALTVAGFRIWTHIGGLTALMIATSALGALTVVPALIILLRPRFLDRGGAGASELPVLRADRDDSAPRSLAAATR